MSENNCDQGLFVQNQPFMRFLLLLLLTFRCAIDLSASVTFEVPFYAGTSSIEVRKFFLYTPPDDGDPLTPPLPEMIQTEYGFLYADGSYSPLRSEFAPASGSSLLGLTSGEKFAVPYSYLNFRFFGEVVPGGLQRVEARRFPMLGIRAVRDSVREGGHVHLRIFLSHPVERSFYVHFCIREFGGAHRDDYTVQNVRKVRIPRGQSYADILLEIDRDHRAEDTEKLRFQLRSAHGYYIYKPFKTADVWLRD